MPTPDREALEARLRAVERALTDADETLAPLDDADEPTAPPDDADEPTAPPDDATADEPAADQPPEGDGERATDAPSRRALERRVLDLEAAVQALRGSLPGVDTGRSRCPECGAERTVDPDAQQPAGGSPAAMSEPDGDGPGATVSERWPDDLAANGGRDGREGG